LVLCIQDLKRGSAILQSRRLQLFGHKNFLKFCQCRLQTLESRRQAAAVGLTCRLVSSTPKGPLSELVPTAETIVDRRSARLDVETHCLRIVDQRDAHSLRCFDRSFRGRIPSIWNRLTSLAGLVQFSDALPIRKQLQREVLEYENTSVNEMLMMNFGLVINDE
jgi:hypothetical protein